MGMIMTNTRESDRQGHSLSVVIPTLGGDSLSGTIGHLNQGTVVPDEILVCIPEDYAHRAEGLPFQNVRVVSTVCRGQVAQRAQGFTQARHEFVLQLDDDIHVRKECLESLLNCITRHGNAAVGPKLHDLQSGEYRSYLVPDARTPRWFEQLLFWVVNGPEGYKPGQIGRAGINMGVPDVPEDLTGLGWLSGGCVLHRRENLVTHDYYPFKGKAYAEDLFHSILLWDKGVNLVRCGTAICDVDFSSGQAQDLVKFLKLYLTYARTMTRFVTGIDGSLARLYLFLILNVARLVLEKMENRTRPTDEGRTEHE